MNWSISAMTQRVFIYINVGHRLNVINKQPTDPSKYWERGEKSLLRVTYSTLPHSSHILSILRRGDYINNLVKNVWNLYLSYLIKFVRHFITKTRILFLFIFHIRYIEEQKFLFIYYYYNFNKMKKICAFWFNHDHRRSLCMHTK